MEENYIGTLDYLIKQKNEKKRSEPTSIDRSRFQEAWVKMAAEEGYSERMEQYLFDEVTFCGAKPFKDYLDHSEDKEKALLSFFSGNMYGLNAETTFRLLVNLFALLLNDKDSAPLIPVIIKWFPSACNTKDKKPLGKADSILLKYFFSEISPKACLAPLSEMKVNKKIAEEFISAMRPIIEKINTNGIAKNKVAAIQKVTQWMEEYDQYGAGAGNEKDASDSRISSTENENNTCGDEASAATTSPDSTEASNGDVGPEVPGPTDKVSIDMSGNSSKDDEQKGSEDIPADALTCLVELLEKAGKAVSTAKSERSQLIIKADTLNECLEEEREKLKRANNQIASLQETVAETKKKLADAEANLFVLKQEVAQRNAEIAEKDAEIAERVKMAEVLSRDRSKQADEMLQRLASKIKVEYRDFADAVDVPMSCDLGENLRLQLQSIFDILEKGGMKIK